MYQTLKCTAQRFIAKDTFSMGAALAYYTAFSLAPLLVIATAIAGMVFGEEAARGEIAEQIEGTVGAEVAKAVQQMLSSARESGATSTATVLGIAALLFGAAGVFGQLQSSLNAVWDVPPQSGGGFFGFLRKRLLSFGMVLGIGFLLLTSLAVSAGISGMSDSLLLGTAVVAQVINQVLSFALTTLLFALIYQILPDRDIAWRDVWVGAAFTSMLFVVGKYLIGLYLGQSGATSAFGAAGSLALVLLWVYYASQILLFGAQFTYVHAMRRTDPNWMCEQEAQRPERASDQTARLPGRQQPAPA